MACAAVYDRAGNVGTQAAVAAELSSMRSGVLLMCAVTNDLLDIERAVGKSLGRAAALL